MPSLHSNHLVVTGVSTSDLQAFDESAQQKAPVVRRSRLGAWTVGSDETAGGEREQQQAQAQPQQQQPRACKSVLASLREGKSLVDPSNARHTQQQQQQRGAIGIPAKPSANGGVRMPQMPGGDWSEAPALVHAPVGQVTGQESQRNVIGESAKEPVWGAQQAVQPTSIREIQQKQQVAERERQAKIQMQQANKPSASGWANQPAAAPNLRDIMAQEQHATGKSVQVPPDPLVAPEPDELNMFWSYQSDAPAPAPSVPARAKVTAPTPAVQKPPAPASRANEDFPALGATIQASGANGVSHGKGIAPKVQASTMVAANSGPMANGKKPSMQAGQAHQNQWSASKVQCPAHLCALLILTVMVTG